MKRARDKVLSQQAALRACRGARRRGETIVFTNGCFDWLDVGHLRSLEQAARAGDRLIVAVNGDASVRRLKGPGRPLVPSTARAELLAGLACVDWVVRFHADTPLALIRRLRPDVLAKGGDWASKDIVGSDLVRGWGGRVLRLREVPGVRSSRLLAAARRSSPR